MAEHKVTIREHKYEPDSLEVKRGDTVIWTNMDEDEHTVTFEDESMEGGEMHQNETHTHLFDEAGTFNYYCEYHPDMTGMVIVKE